MAVAAEGTGVGSTQYISRCGIGVRGHGEEEPFSLWFCPVRKLMLSAGLLFTPRFSWSASLVKLGFAFVQFRQLPLQKALPTRFETIPSRPISHALANTQRALGRKCSRAPSASSTIIRGPDRLGLVQGSAM